jgi:hypothetical protein
MQINLEPGTGDIYTEPEMQESERWLLCGDGFRWWEMDMGD